MTEQESFRWKSPHRKAIYQQLVREFDVPDLPDYALKQVAEDKGGLGFLRACLYYMQNQESLLRRYAGQHVAIVGKSVITVSPDYNKLKDSLPARYKDQLVFMSQVRRGPHLILQAS